MVGVSLARSLIFGLGRFYSVLLTLGRTSQISLFARIKSKEPLEQLMKTPQVSSQSA